MKPSSRNRLSLNSLNAPRRLTLPILEAPTTLVAFPVPMHHEPPRPDGKKQPLSIWMRTIRLGLGFVLAVGLGMNAAQAAPSIQSIDVSPNPLVTGQSFTVAVAGSDDVTQGIVIADFRLGVPRVLQLPLTKQGAVWTASSFVPVDLRRQLPGNVGSIMRVILFDATGRRAEAVVQAGVQVTSVSAVLAGGILTVTGDDHDNTLVVSRDVAGNILVNGGAIPVAGGVPTVVNTALVRILGLGGNDVLTVDDGNGPMPSANLLGGDGDDTLTGSASDDELDGGPGNDTLNGRGGNDRLLGGDGNDLLIGGQGSDELIGGAGDDQIVWNPGDGSDLVEGQDGQDTLVFNGANISEQIDLSANGTRLRFFRNVANITMDCDGVERVIFRALGGADSVSVNDLAGTQVAQVLVDLTSADGTGDGAADTVTVNGTAGDDHITLSGSAAGVDVLGLHTAVTVVGGEPDLDKLVVSALDGADLVDASAVLPGAIGLVLNGGRGNDQLMGGQGNDVLIGGQGDDLLLGGAGDDTFPWNPGDGSDTIEGQDGQDTMLFNGANIAEAIDISANGRRVRFTRNVATITMDCDGVELIQFNALGGADDIVVNDLSGTAVRKVNINLAAPADSNMGDGAADTVTVMGTTGNDAVHVAPTATGLSVTGLAAEVSLSGSEGALDQLIVKLLAGDDAFEASNLPAGLIILTVDGGDGNDVLAGSAGADTLLGGNGDDVLLGGPGLDTLDGGPGSNTVIQD